jgi:hypothetical protein
VEREKAKRIQEGQLSMTIYFIYFVVETDWRETRKWQRTIAADWIGLRGFDVQTLWAPTEPASCSVTKGSSRQFVRTILSSFAFFQNAGASRIV